MKYKLKYCINISCVVNFQNKPTWNYSILFLLFSFLQKQFCCQWLFESSSIWFIIHLSTKNIIHPWHVVEYFSMSSNILFRVSNNILLMSTRYSWKYLLGFTCSHSCAHHLCSQDNNPVDKHKILIKYHAKLMHLIYLLKSWFCYCA
jgi:hypothetical protein